MSHRGGGGATPRRLLRVRRRRERRGGVVALAAAVRARGDAQGVDSLEELRGVGGRADRAHPVRFLLGFKHRLSLRRVRRWHVLDVIEPRFLHRAHLPS